MEQSLGRVRVVRGDEREDTYLEGRPEVREDGALAIHNAQDRIVGYYTSRTWIRYRTDDGPSSEPLAALSR
jgi:hypothetical protein